MDKGNQYSKSKTFIESKNSRKDHGGGLEAKTTDTDVRFLRNGLEVARVPSMHNHRISMAALDDSRRENAHLRAKVNSLETKVNQLISVISKMAKKL